MTIHSDHCKYLCYCFANNRNMIMKVGSTQTLCWYAMSSLCPVYLSSLATLHLLSTTLAIPFHWPLQIGIQQTSEVAMLLKAFWLIRQHTSLLLWLFSGFTVCRGQRQTIELTLWADAATQLNTCVCVCVVRLVSSCHDEASRFLRLTAKPGRDFIEFDDFLPLVQVSLVVSCRHWLIIINNYDSKAIFRVVICGNVICESSLSRMSSVVVS